MKKVLLFFILINLSLFAQSSRITSIEGVYIMYFLFRMNSILILFSFFLIFCLGIITPFIVKLANKNEDYRKKKFFIIYEKSTRILFLLHIILNLINIIISIFAKNIFTENIFLNLIFALIYALIIGGGGITIIYENCYILDKNNIAIDKSIINKIFYYIKKIKKIIVSTIVLIIIIKCVMFIIEYLAAGPFSYIDLEFFYLEFFSGIIDNINSEYMPILVAIFCLVFILIFLVIKINSTVVIINQKLNKINKNIENNKSASSSEVETTKKDKNDNDYII